jgi:hypothetical protein
MDWISNNVSEQTTYRICLHEGTGFMILHAFPWHFPDFWHFRGISRISCISTAFPGFQAFLRHFPDIVG